MVNRWEISKWVNNLRSLDITAQKISVNALGLIAKGGGAKEIVKEKGVNPLVQCMFHKNSDIRSKAILTISNIAKGGWSKEVVEEKGITPLVRNLSDNDANVRVCAASVLAYILKDGLNKEVVEANGIAPLIYPIAKDLYVCVQHRHWPTLLKVDEVKR